MYVKVYKLLSYKTNLEYKVEVLKVKVIYLGIFIKDKNLGGTLENKVNTPHVTLEFRPKVIPNEILGNEVEIKVTNYGNNNRNEGYKVVLPQEYERYFKGKIPHITLSYSNESKALDTKNIKFDKEKSLTLIGKVGILTDKGIKYSLN